jgi:tetratricopeptide (TPR) repeat protein
MARRWHRAGLAIALWLVTAGAYLPTRGHDFVSFDDPQYVAENARLAQGLTRDGLVRTFTESYFYNWHPLTTLTYAVDHRLWGLWAGGYLLSNLLLHATATALLFLALARLTGATAPSLFVAAVFGLHPLHVEAVAWVSQRKDVLSGVFFMAGLLAYARWVERPGLGRYAALLVCFALGLLAKPMLVTLPFVLVLLDVWPLGRLPVTGVRRAREALPRLLAEKLPLFALAAASSVVTYLVQKGAGAVATFDRVPLRARLLNAPQAYLAYLERVFWPERLAFFYPLHPEWLSLRGAAPAAVALAILTVVAGLALRRSPWVPVGWGWFLGMLVPVIGLVQVGSQAFADRYAYLPLVGVVIAVAWSAQALAARNRTLRIALAGLAVVVCGALLVQTERQIAVWRDGATLGEHALAVGFPSATAHTVIASALLEQDDVGRARLHVEAAIALDPRAAGPRALLAELLSRDGKLEAAVVEYRRALALDPRLQFARAAMGRTLVLLGRPGEALASLTQAQAGGLEVAQPEIEVQIGLALAAQGDLAGAAQHYRAAIALRPDLVAAHANLGVALTQGGQLVDGETELRRAADLSPDEVRVQGGLADNLQRQGRIAEAIDRWRETVRLAPDDAAAANNLAWLLATADDPRLRRPDEAVALAERVVASTGGADAGALDTLAMAYEAAGRREEAVATARRAADRARESGDAGLARDIEARLARWQSEARESKP